MWPTIVTVLCFFALVSLSALRARTDYLGGSIFLGVLGIFHVGMCLIGFVPEADRAVAHLRRVAA